MKPIPKPSPVSPYNKDPLNINKNPPKTINPTPIYPKIAKNFDQ
jgi:hypothetical protein